MKGQGHRRSRRLNLAVVRNLGSGPLLTRTSLGALPIFCYLSSTSRAHWLCDKMSYQE
ncbi:hypothetical protein I79_007286 [Cricetulus griseus]|uniref:Uncharacterized protein n=1 Tax=Cricetulus griseus TaxID=10029 RepID=G3HA44_CRIGR|nr:hypothetical protein I79_007286 [Cricetulus griseus]